MSEDQNQQRYPWEPGTATGIGSMPETNPDEVMRVIADELPDFPHLPELPGRGPGADMVGRTAGLLVDIPAEVTPRGWRLAERPGRDMARARSMLSTDLDVMEEVLEGYRGPLKIQLCGPWTLAAALELPRTMNVAIADPGAVADLTASLAEGAAAYAADVAKRVPGPSWSSSSTSLRSPPWPRAWSRPRAGCPGWPRSRNTLRDRLEQVITSTQCLHGRALLRSQCPVRALQGCGGRRRRLRPRPATAR